MNSFCKFLHFTAVLAAVSAVVGGAAAFALAGKFYFCALLFAALFAGATAPDIRYLFFNLLGSTKPLKSYIELARENDSLVAELSQAHKVRENATAFAEELLDEWKRHEQSTQILESIKYAPDRTVLSNN